MKPKAWSVPGECAIVSHSAVFLFVVCKNSHPQWSSEFTFLHVAISVTITAWPASACVNLAPQRLHSRTSLERALGLID